MIEVIWELWDIMETIRDSLSCWGSWLGRACSLLFDALVDVSRPLVRGKLDRDVSMIRRRP